MKTFFWLIFAAFVVLFHTGCGESNAPVEITEVKDVDTSHDFEIPVLAESDASRFRFRPTTSTDSPKAPSDSSPKLTWKTPDGWQDAGPKTMRDVNLTFGENGEGECYVTRLSGDGGGMLANVNRWRGQLGATNLTEEEVAALPKKTLLGQPATVVSVEGTYAGMGGAAKEGQKLHGIILMIEGAMVTVKMTGPAELVSANEVKFDAFCASLDLRSAN